METAKYVESRNVTTSFFTGYVCDFHEKHQHSAFWVRIEFSYVNSIAYERGIKQVESIRPPEPRLQVTRQYSEGITDTEEHDCPEYVKEECQVKIGCICSGSRCDLFLQFDDTANNRKQRAILHQCNKVVGKRRNSNAKCLWQYDFAHDLACVQT